MTKFTIREEMVKCGRPGCKSCPHGPYRYKYWREGGKLRKKYLGKPEDQELFDEEGEPKQSALSAQDALSDREILGVPTDASFTECRKKFREWTKLLGKDKSLHAIEQYRTKKAAYNRIRGNRR